MTDHSKITPGTLSRGDETKYGTIEMVSLTAYRIAGCWVPFRDIHGTPAPVEPLVVFG